jgi:hypothetical protein
MNLVDTLNQNKTKHFRNHQHQNSLGLRHRHHSLKILPLDLMKQEYIACNVSLGVFYTMQGQLI